MVLLNIKIMLIIVISVIFETRQNYSVCFVPGPYFTIKIYND